ncbi:MAG: hypothetical protein ABIQ88_02080 [Chitinophagaceae bacterium]
MNKKKVKAVAGLLADESFLDWHLQTNKVYEQYWDEWINEKPAHALLAATAVKLLQIITAPSVEKISCPELNASFERLLKKIMHLDKIEFVTKN